MCIYIVITIVYISWWKVFANIYCLKKKNPLKIHLNLILFVKIQQFGCWSNLSKIVQLTHVFSAHSGCFENESFSPFLWTSSTDSLSRSDSTIRLGIVSLLNARMNKEDTSLQNLPIQVQVEEAAFYYYHYNYGSTGLVSHSAKPEHRTTEVNLSCDLRLRLELIVLNSSLMHSHNSLWQTDIILFILTDTTYMQSSVWRFYPENITSLSPPPGFKRSVINLNNRLETHAQNDAPGVKKDSSMVCAFYMICIPFSLRSAQYIWFMHPAKCTNLRVFNGRTRSTRFIQLTASVERSVQYWRARLDAARCQRGSENTCTQRKTSWELVWKKIPHFSISPPRKIKIRSLQGKRKSNWTWQGCCCDDKHADRSLLRN